MIYTRGGGGGVGLYSMWFQGGSLDLNFVRRRGVIQKLDDGSKFQPPPIHLNNERSLNIADVQ